MRSANDSLAEPAAGLVASIQAGILARFPSASFNVRIGPDGRVYLAAYTDAAQDFEVQDLVSEQTVDALIAGEVKVHVFPRQHPPLAPEANQP